MEMNRILKMDFLSSLYKDSVKFLVETETDDPDASSPEHFAVSRSFKICNNQAF